MSMDLGRRQWKLGFTTGVGQRPRQRTLARKIGIAAVARRLVIDLWRYLDAGVIPDGALLKERATVASEG